MSDAVPAFYSVNDVAERFGVTPATVREWIKQGKLRAGKTPSASGKGKFRISELDLREYVNSIYGEPA